MTILSLCTDKVNMHSRQEQEFLRLLTQLSTEESKQANVSEVYVFKEGRRRSYRRKFLHSGIGLKPNNIFMSLPCRPSQVPCITKIVIVNETLVTTPTLVMCLTFKVQA